jgi:hypothetical protein
MPMDSEGRAHPAAHPAALTRPFPGPGRARLCGRPAPPESVRPARRGGSERARNQERDGHGVPAGHCRSLIEGQAALALNVRVGWAKKKIPPSR